MRQKISTYMYNRKFDFRIGSLYFVGRLRRLTWKLFLRARFTSSSSPAVTERPRDASCLSVVSLNSTKRRVQFSVVSYFRFRFTAAWVQINKLFFSVLFSSSWSSTLVVMNIVTAVCAVNCARSTVAGSCSHCSSHGSIFDSQLLVDNRDLCLPHLHSTLPFRGSRRNIAMTFGVEKLVWCGYPMVKFFYMFIRFDRIHERDGGQKDTAWRHFPHSCTAFLPRNAIHKRGLYRRAVSPSVRHRVFCRNK